MKKLKAIYKKGASQNYIPPNLYSENQVKQGLRNENGTGVKVGLTKICDVIGYKIQNGQKKEIPGELIYRGYPIQILIHRQNGKKIQGYEETAFLLIFGKLPSQRELNWFQSVWKHPKEPELCLDYHSSNLLNALQIEILKMYGQDLNPEADCLEDRFEKGIHILSVIPLLIFSHFYGKPILSYPLPEKSLAENILTWVRKNETYTFQEAKVMDTLLMLHADHGGGNNSTFANVVISSTGTDIYSCISAAIGSLKGPRHGGAASKVSMQFEAIIKEIGVTSDPIVLKDLIHRILNKDFFDHSGLIYGIGHAIYTYSDPRAKIIKEECKKLAIEKNELDLFNMLDMFEKSAVEIMRKEKNIICCANIDFYSGFAYRMLHIDSSLFTPLFAISRIAGWIAHHLENRQSNRKLIRPANVYVGGIYNESNNHSI